MLFENVAFFNDNKGFLTGSVEIKSNRIVSIREYDCIPEKKIIPGLIDIHFHGNSGEDISDGNYNGLKKIARYHARNGVTRFSAATMTMPEKIIQKACKNLVKLRNDNPDGCARVVGITMEGPFFSEKKKGAQAAENLCLPDIMMTERIKNICEGLLKIVCVAPELDGAIPFIREVSKYAKVSLAHTDASYDEAMIAYKEGASHTTHLFNAMPPFLHRDPGVIGAALDNKNVTVEIISDGVHLHPATVRMVFTAFGSRRVCLISDSMSACGMSNGKYYLGGQEVYVTGNKAVLADGTIAGSATPLFLCMKKAISFGIPEEDAVRSATMTPAKVLGISDDFGSIEPGKIADFIVCSLDYEIDTVYIDGIAIE